VNINSGGGQVLLDAVIKNKDFGEVTKLFIDERSKSKYEGIEVHKIKPSLWSRYAAEYELQKYCRSNPNQQVLFFGNLPPVFKISANCSLFLQNAYLLKTINLPKPIKQKIRYIYERAIFYTFTKKRINEVFVQTKWMKENLKTAYKGLISVKKVYPILPKTPDFKQEIKDPKILVITGPEPHKNLNKLKEALETIRENITIRVVTSSPIHLKNPRINLEVIQSASRVEIFELYNSSTHLVALSDFESFCLPLYEAKHFKLKIIAPIKGYITKEVYPDYIIENILPIEIAKTLVQAIYEFKTGGSLNG